MNYGVKALYIMLLGEKIKIQEFNKSLPKEENWYHGFLKLKCGKWLKDNNILIKDLTY